MFVVGAQLATREVSFGVVGANHPLTPIEKAGL